MPEDGGSTTVSASIIAIAASAALPPARKISRPASLARGSADETAPRASEGVSGERAAVEGATQAERSNRGSASRARTDRKSGGMSKEVVERVDLRGGRIIKKKKK